MHFTIFHLLAFIILFLCFILICIIIFLKVKQKESALLFYTINTIFSSLLIYSTFLTINQFTVKASIEKLNYTRDLRNENLIIKGKVKNLTKFDIKKCYLYLNMVDRKKANKDIFYEENLKKAKMKSDSVSHIIEIIDKLPGNTYKEFSATIPFPPSFSNPEIYNTLKCI
ncbi:DUF2393 family protein [Campylobacter novaezeelandiae]|uniref:DUF2393 family protein n=1 Tax=Campylobacter novaezeelandiae TaxID=2267891 RepID=UPI00190855BF|nr:DUF2393 family protein [Campylobacter novaezeelandiae]MBK1963806.1 DUF2393 family protein [Campylobacter novaezeelandiae]